MYTYRRFWTASLLTILILCVATLTLAHSPVSSDQTLPEPASLTDDRPVPVEPDLLKTALQAPETPLDFIIYLTEQADLSKWLPPAQPPSFSLQSSVFGLQSSVVTRQKLQRRQVVVDALQATATKSQAGLLADLNTAAAKGKVTHIKPFWVVNAIAVQGQGEALLELARRPDVQIIRANRRWTLDTPPPTRADTPDPSPSQPQPSVFNPQSSVFNPQSSIFNLQSSQWHIQHTRADLVWSLLGMDGKGVVVANMDTGVDWQHPDLQPVYRGYDPRGLPNHRGNWYCATDEGYLYPGDGNGHGTHVMGLMVGQRGYGTAPGARWIAVKTFNDSRQTTDAWIHDAFQWLLAPGGDPALAPDIVNGSWSSAARDSLVYRDDVRALRAAGILPVFSAGNDGPLATTVGVPGGYPEVLTVGATDLEDRVAFFSSRGPSPFAPIKPDLVAPGVHVLSTFHGGGYAYNDGTSMSTPIVAGIAALLWQARPDMTGDQIAATLRATARPIGVDALPNNNVGAGLTDAYAALSVATGAAELAGRVTRVGDGGPVPGATITIQAQATGASLRVETNASGVYTVPLQAGVYNVSVQAFGYASAEQRGIVLVEGQKAELNFSLTLLPVGVILGRVTDAAGAPRPATIIVEDTPITTTAQANTGAYSLALPPGTYRLRAELRGYRIARAEVTITTPGVALERYFVLTEAPTILVVDTGAWYFANTLSYYRDALHSRDYLHDVHSITSVQDNGLTLQKLRAYHIVIWSSPKDSPRLVGADRLVRDYLREGGRLIISGQDIAYWDGGGGSFVAEYFRGMLNARFVADRTDAARVVGAGPFQGTAWSLGGADSANNQTALDVIAAVKPEASSVAALYPPDRGAGILVNTCAPFRSLYLSFGVEGVQGLTQRADLLERALTLMRQPTPAQAFTLHTNSLSEVAAANGVITYTLTLRNIGGAGDDYRVQVSGSQWPTEVIDPATRAVIETVRVETCATRDVLIRVKVPSGMGWNSSDTATVRVSSAAQDSAAPAQTVQLVSRTPAPVLLVDDDQFLDVETTYTQALDQANIPYNVWEIGHPGDIKRGSPSLERLKLYPVVVWFTSYDFLDTLTPQEEARLATYLNSGGRLLFSSQDYLFTAGLTRFGLDYLGVLTYTEDLTTDTLVGVAGDAIGNGLGPFPLDYERVFQSRRYNHSDALAPTLLATPTFLGGHRLPVGLRLDRGNFRTAFFAAPLEVMTVPDLAQTLRRTIGWLNPLGASTITSDRRVLTEGDSVTYSIEVKNAGTTPRQRVRLENAIPPHTQLIPDSVVGASVENGKVVWTGALAPGAAHGLRYRVTVGSGLPAATEILNTATITDETGLTSEIFTMARVNIPDLSPSVALADRERVLAGDLVNFTISLRNRGSLDAMGTLTVSLPADLTLLPESVGVSVGTVSVEGHQLRWTGPVSRTGLPVILAYQARVADAYTSGPLRTSVLVSDGFGPPLDRSITIGAVHELVLPLIIRGSRP